MLKIFLMNDSPNWIQVYTCSTEYEALFIKGYLESEGVQSSILSQIDSTRQFTLGNLAVVKIYVLEAFYEKAVGLLKEYENQKDEK